MVTVSCLVNIRDFGLAKLTGETEATDEDETTTDLGLTEAVCPRFSGFG